MGIWHRALAFAAGLAAFAVAALAVLLVLAGAGGTERAEAQEPVDCDTGALLDPPIGAP